MIFYPFNSLNKSSHESQNACMDGNNKSAPAANKTLSSRGPVLTATVKMPAACPASTGHFLPQLLHWL